MDKIEKAVIVANAETGVYNRIPLCIDRKPSKRRWTVEEENFIKDNYVRSFDVEMAKCLGRTLIGVRLHIKREMHLVSRSKDPAILTAEQVANGLGIDGKSVHLLMDTGRMPCRLLPGIKTMRVIDRVVFMKWMLNTENWLYFRQERVGAFFRRGKRGLGKSYDFALWENARRIILKKRRQWKDCWLRPGQVKCLLRIDAVGTRYINKAILAGMLKAKRWGNWWIKKSDLPKGKTINFRGEIKNNATMSLRNK